MVMARPVQNVEINFHPEFNPFNRFYLLSDCKFNYACQFVINFTGGTKYQLPHVSVCTPLPGKMADSNCRVRPPDL